MNRICKLLLTLGVSIAVFAGAYAFLLTSGREPLRLETLSGDPIQLEPYEISFSLADNTIEQRYTLRSGTITQKNRFLEAGHRWLLRSRQTSSSPSFGVRHYDSDLGGFFTESRDLFIRPQSRVSDSGTLLLPGVYRLLEYSSDPERAAPVFTLTENETLSGFWQLDDALYCGVEHGGQTELRQYSAAGVLLETYPLGETKRGLLLPAYASTPHTSWHEGPYDERGHFVTASPCPPDPDDAQLFPLGDRLLVIGAWVEDQASGVDLYLLEPGNLLYHGRIATRVWEDYRSSPFQYGDIDGVLVSDAPLRYFTMAEALTKS